MPLHLAHDADAESNVETLPIGNLMDIPGMARRFAEQVEAGEHGKPVRALLIVENELGIAGLLWGENATEREKIGMLEWLKMMIFAADADDE